MAPWPNVEYYIQYAVVGRNDDECRDVRNVRKASQVGLISVLLKGQRGKKTAMKVQNLLMRAARTAKDNLLRYRLQVKRESRYEVN